jgi:hypothetical protein
MVALDAFLNAVLDMIGQDGRGYVEIGIKAI